MADRILSSSSPPRRRPWFPAVAFLLVGLGAAGGWWWESRRTVANDATIEARLADPNLRVEISAIAALD